MKLRTAVLTVLAAAVTLASVAAAGPAATKQRRAVQTKIIPQGTLVHPAAGRTALKPPGSSFLGTWTGTGYQFDNGSTWTIRMAITALKVGAVNQIDYPSIGCGGTLTVSKVTTRGRPVLYLREKLEYGHRACVDNGAVRLVRIRNGRLNWRWFYADGTYGARATLVRRR
jgi:hypothetical protein